MGQSAERLERLITAQEGECCGEDIDRRIDTLAGRIRSFPPDTDRDRAVLKTLGDETRYTIARLLVTAERELCVCEITPLLEVSESAVSHALSDLADAGLLTRRKEGTWRYYEATDRTRSLFAALDETRGES
jgi:DNA-binding transcriptional ArsR family regulator